MYYSSNVQSVISIDNPSIFFRNWGCEFKKDKYINIFYINIVDLLKRICKSKYCIFSLKLEKKKKKNSQNPPPMNDIDFSM